MLTTRLGMSEMDPPNSIVINEFVLKIAARCNLACDYCYEYFAGDDTWKTKPNHIDLRTVEVVAKRIVDHCESHGSRAVSISLHGGEPLSVGEDRFEAILAILCDEFSLAGIELNLSIQTNGVLISDRYAEIFNQYGLDVGISFDGDRFAHNRHRKYANGAGSYDDVVKGVALLKSTYPDRLSGALCVIDVRNDPIAVVDAIHNLGIGSLDLLLPHFNWDRTPPKYSETAVPYAKWLIQVWDAWVRGRWGAARIRVLDNLVMRMVGHPGIYEEMSTNAVSLITIDSAGFVEGVDTLKSTASGYQITGINLLNHSIDRAVLERPISQRYRPESSLSEACKRCEHVNICMGGYFPHRYSSENGFSNPSVYCDDLKYLIEYVMQSLRDGIHAT